MKLFEKSTLIGLTIFGWSLGIVTGMTLATLPPGVVPPHGFLHLLQTLSLVLLSVGLLGLFARLIYDHFQLHEEELTNVEVIEPIFPDAKSALSLMEHPRVQQAHETIERAYAQAHQEGDIRWQHDAAEAQKYITEVLDKHQKVFGPIYTVELEEMVGKVEAISTQHNRPSLRAQQDWQELKMFLADRERSI